MTAFIVAAWAAYALSQHDGPRSGLLAGVAVVLAWFTKASAAFLRRRDRPRCGPAILLLASATGARLRVTGHRPPGRAAWWTLAGIAWRGAVACCLRPAALDRIPVLQLADVGHAQTGVQRPRALSIARRGSRSSTTSSRGCGWSSSLALRRCELVARPLARRRVPAERLLVLVGACSGSPSSSCTTRGTSGATSCSSRRSSRSPRSCCSQAPAPVSAARSRIAAARWLALVPLCSRCAISSLGSARPACRSCTSPGRACDGRAGAARC